MVRSGWYVVRVEPVPSLRVLVYRITQVTLVGLVCLLAAEPAASQDARLGGAADDTVRVTNAPLRDVIKVVEEATGFRFLYRDALIANHNVSMSAGVGDAIDSLVVATARLGIVATVDVNRRQVLLSARERGRARESDDTSNASGPIAISGTVLDADTGEPLPYATVSWESAHGLSGVVSDESGRVTVPRVGGPRESALVRFSYVGYEPVVVRRDELAAAFGIRLNARGDLVAEVVVSAVPLEAEVDSVWGRAVMSSDLSILGADNAIRALQALPAVSISGAISGGTIVRGSRPDGFQVLLDGIPVYRPTHLFGLFDAFNADALTAVGLYYAVSPAELAGPPGGTISFVTRGGSRQRLAQRVGLSSTAATATLEGPITGGRGSWLLSFRRSLLDTFGWFGNDELVGVGLDIDRETSAPPIVTSLNERVVRPGESSALFYDLHAKAVLEDANGGRWQLSGYLGGDQTAQDAERFVATQGDSLRRVRLVEVSSSHDWSNRLFGVQRQGGVGSGLYTVNASYSGYSSDYFKGDFPFVRRQDAAPLLAELVVDTLQSNNQLDDIGAAGKIARPIRNLGSLTLGLDGHAYALTYDEISGGSGRSFAVTDNAWLLDAYVSSTLNWSILSAQVGTRTHFFSGDNKLRLSPRLRLSAQIGTGTSLFVGYSRSHQFLHQLSLDYTTNARIWALSTEAERPGVADHVTAGMRASGRHVAVQVEAYHKNSTGVRQHVTAVSRRIRDTGFVLAPWVHDFDGLARGVEAMVRGSSRRLHLSAGYTLSRADLRHHIATDGDWVPADWDRRHQVVLTAELALPGRVRATAQWLYGTGAPNTLSPVYNREPERLDAYHRMDVSLAKHWTLGGASVSALITVYNVYDRDNPWYRTAVAVLDGPLNDLRLRTTAVDVYDLGLRPSFNLSVRR